MNVQSDAVRQVLEYAQQLVKYLPDDAVSYDDASNNRALISGKSALIWNPPSAWAVAKRDAPKVAEDCWTFPAPKGPKGGSCRRWGRVSWGIWDFSPNKTAAKELIEFLLATGDVEARCNVVMGALTSAVRQHDRFQDLGPGRAAERHGLPLSHSQVGSPGELIALAPAPPEVAVQAYNRGTLPTMLAKLKSGQSIKDVQDWATDELSGFVR